MKRVWKEVLCKGTAQDRHGREFTFTDAHIRDGHRNVQLMLSRGVPLPAVWEHQDIEANKIPATPEALAEWKRRYAKFTFGHIAGARINDRGNLDLLHEVRDDRDADQLLKTRYVSPKVYPSYSDSRGGRYRGTTIAHVAATPTPVQFWQRPFELSQGDALYLSYTPPEGPDVPESDDDKGKKGGSGGDLGALIQALREANLTIPDEVTDIPGLVIAVKAGKKAPAGDSDLDLDDLDDEPGAGGGGGGAGDTTSAGGPPMLMSDERAEPFKKMTRRDLAGRIKRLHSTGRVDRPTALKLLQKAGAVELSFTVAGDLAKRPDVLADVEAYERLPKGLVLSAKGGGPAPEELELSTTDVDLPKGLAGKGGTGTATDWLCNGLPAAAKK